MIYKAGPLRGEKIQFLDGISYSIWYPFGDDEECIEAFDFPEEDLDALRELIDILVEAPPCIMRDIDLEYFGEDQSGVVDKQLAVATCQAAKLGSQQVSR